MRTSQQRASCDLHAAFCDIKVIRVSYRSKIDAITKV